MEKVNDYKEYRFQAVLQLIGINPYVEIPPPILLAICNDAKRSKGPIPIVGTINQQPYQKKETLVKNIALAMGFLKGENRFIGRDPIKRN